VNFLHFCAELMFKLNVIYVYPFGYVTEAAVFH
jgi:hypothetical protein